MASGCNRTCCSKRSCRVQPASVAGATQPARSTSSRRSSGVSSGSSPIGRAGSATTPVEQRAQVASQARDRRLVEEIDVVLELHRKGAAAVDHLHREVELAFLLVERVVLQAQAAEVDGRRRPWHEHRFELAQLIEALQHEQHFEQRRAARVTHRLQLLDDKREREILRVERVETRSGAALQAARGTADPSRAASATRWC